MRTRIQALAKRLLLLAAALALVIVFLEIGLRLAYPQTMMTPRYDFTAETGIINHPDVTIRHRRPGVFDYRYTVNADRYRGEPVPFDGPWPRLLALGDSYTFGIGVEDERTYPRLLEAYLGGRYRVVNLGNGGWGLTHQIARYLSFGERFDPRVVVLQFSANDPRDNRQAPLVRPAGAAGEFELTPVPPGGTGKFKALLESSPRLYRLLTGHSQLYNLVRDGAYRAMASRDRERNAGPPGDEQAHHVELLRHFAVRLRRDGARLIFIAVQGDLAAYPEIEEGVRRLAAQGLLEYLETERWFPRTPEYASPEGHAWGGAGHEAVARGLADYLSDSSSSR